VSGYRMADDGGNSVVAAGEVVRLTPAAGQPELQGQTGIVVEVSHGVATVEWEDRRSWHKEGDIEPAPP